MAEDAQEAKVTITINRDLATMGDMRRMVKMRAKHAERKAGEQVENSPAEMDDYLDMLDRLVVGGLDVVPLDNFPDVVAAVFNALAAPKN